MECLLLRDKRKHPSLKYLSPTVLSSFSAKASLCHPSLVPKPLWETSCEGKIVAWLGVGKYFMEICVSEGNHPQKGWLGDSCFGAFFLGGEGRRVVVWAGKKALWDGSQPFVLELLSSITPHHILFHLECHHEFPSEWLTQTPHSFGFALIQRQPVFSFDRITDPTPLNPFFTTLSCKIFAL